MKITKIHYFFTAPNNMYWQKIGAEAEIIEGDDVRQCLYSLKKEVESFFYESTKAEEKREAVINKEKMETDLVTEGQWQEVKKKLLSIKSKEEAQEYLDSTDFRLTIEAKNIVNSKPSKNEKGNTKK